MIRLKEVPEGILLELTDKAFLLEEFPDLDTGLYEIMEYCDFAPEGTKNEDWDDISDSIGRPAIGYLIYDYGGLQHVEDAPHRMYEYKHETGNILQVLIDKGPLLFTPFEFKPYQPPVI